MQVELVSVTQVKRLIRFSNPKLLKFSKYLSMNSLSELMSILKSPMQIANLCFNVVEEF